MSNEQIKEATNRLWNAIGKNNVQEVKQAILDGADLTDKRSRGETPLFAALGERHKQITQLLIAAGSDMNTKNNLEEFPLSILASYGWLDVLQQADKLQLIDYGLQSSARQTALMQAIIKNKTDVAKFLISRMSKEQLNIQSKEFATALSIATYEKNIEIVDELLKAGANPNLTNNYNVSPLIFAVRPSMNASIPLEQRISDSKIITELLLKAGADPLHKATSGNTAFFEACYVYNRPVIELLLNYDVVLNGYTGAGFLGETPPLGTILGYHDIDLAKKMLEKGARIDFKNSKGETPINFLVNAGIPEKKDKKETDKSEKDSGVAGKVKDAAKGILGQDKKIDPSVKEFLENVKKKTPEKVLELYKLVESYGAKFPPVLAIYSVHASSEEFIEFCQEKGLLNEICTDQNLNCTALGFAFRSGNWKMLSKLESCGASWTAPNAKGTTAAHFAVAYPKILHYAELLQVLDMSSKKEDQDKKEEIRKKIMEETEVLYKRILSVSEIVNTQDNKGLTPLHLLISKTLTSNAISNECLKSIIDSTSSAIDWSLKTEEGDNYLVYAAKYLKKTELAWFVDIFEKNGFSEQIKSAILDLSWTAPEEFSKIPTIKENIAYLIERGALINYQDMDGQSACLVAAGTNQEDLLESLIELGANINIKNNEGNTPLIQATSENYSNIVRVLLAAEADMSIVNNKGMTALDVSVEKQHYQSMEKLKNKDYELRAAKRSSGMGR